jgi:15-cis-phytoene synthase
MGLQRATFFDPNGVAVNNPGCKPLGNFQSSILYCRRVTRLANSSFPIAFRLLPPAKQRAMEALYAFLRVSDDLADEPGEIPAKWERLQAWRAGLLAAIEGKFNHPIHPALFEAVQRFGIPPELLLDALDGVETDIEPMHFATFADLYPYCYRVASAVGLACVRVWGFRSCVSTKDIHAATKAAEAAGIAFQLTNILRDLNEDWGRGRVYLPSDELARFGVSPEEWRVANGGSEFRTLMQFQVARAKDYYRLAEPLDSLLSTEGRAIFRVMAGTYRRLLGEIEKDIPHVLTRRIRVPSWRKGLILLSGWAIKWGWL